jgi:beta-glucosidase
LDLPSSPLYPFGYGLSYSKFVFRNLHLDTQLRTQGEMQVSIEITNTGTRTGEEVAQLYVREPVSAIARPALELKQFARVELKPGETREVTFTIKRAQLASLHPNMRYAVSPGTYSVALGPNSAQLMEARFEVPALKAGRSRKTGAHVPSATVSGKRAKAGASGP